MTTATCPKCQEQVTKLGPEYITIDGTRWIICEKCAKGDKMTVTVIVKRGERVLADIRGAEVDPKRITMGDVHTIYATENFLERITGHRWHISINTGEEDVDIISD